MSTGAYLLGASDPVAGQTFALGLGHTTLGRSEDSDVVIRDSTVSHQHAEISVSSGRVSITNLMATNGVRVNGEPVATASLSDGDVIRAGRVAFVFKDVAPSAAYLPLLSRAPGWLLFAAAIAAVALAWLLWS